MTRKKVAEKRRESVLNTPMKCGTIVKRMNRYMVEALKEAKKAEALEEVPIGAVVVTAEGEIVGRGYNRTRMDKDPTGHGEIIALRQAAAALGRERLPGCDLYVTVEPCAMCAGAIIQARLRCVYIGTEDPKGGACGSVFNILQEEKLNHKTEIQTGVMRDECTDIMQRFFKKLRKRNGGNNK